MCTNITLMTNINEEFISCVKAGNIDAVAAMLEPRANVHFEDNHALR